VKTGKKYGNTIPNLRDPPGKCPGKNGGAKRMGQTKNSKKEPLHQDKSEHCNTSLGKRTKEKTKPKTAFPSPFKERKQKSADPHKGYESKAKPQWGGNGKARMTGGKEGAEKKNKVNPGGCWKVKGGHYFPRVGGKRNRRTCVKARNKPLTVKDIQKQT